MKIRTFLLASVSAISAIGTNAANGATIYTADFSTAGIGFTHSTTSPPSATGDTASGSNWTISYPSAPATDGSDNTFITAGGSLTASDWGGDGSFFTNAIDVSGATSVDISGTGSGTFNSAPTEFFTWYYILDGGTPVTASMTTGSFDQTFSSVDTSAASSLVVGFDFNHNGSSDGFNITGVTVDAVPEPSSALLGAIGALALLRRRR